MKFAEDSFEQHRFEDRWTVYRTRFLVRARQLAEPMVFTDVLGREQSGQAGDYLVEFSDGIRRITSRSIFEDIYVPLRRESKPVSDFKLPALHSFKPATKASAIPSRGL